MRAVKKKNKIVICALSGLILFCAVICALLYSGVIHLNHPELSGYNIKGVDVSSYQGDIDWNVLAGQDIDFAILKPPRGHLPWTAVSKLTGSMLRKQTSASELIISSVLNRQAKSRPHYFAAL